jgi:DNA-directed RNA polymerase subunit RPC12/RpoP
VDLKRNIKCSKCGTEIYFNFNGNIDLTQMTAVGKCPSCGTTLQIDFAVIEKEKPPESSYSSPAAASGIPQSESVVINLEEALSQESPVLHNLME